MTGTIVVGVIITLMFLVSFTEWFYHVVVGFNEVALRDIFFSYRIAAWVIAGVTFMGGTFWTLALTNECPLLEKERPGVFKYMNCDVYWEMRSFVERKPPSVLLEEAADKEAELNYE